MKILCKTVSLVSRLIVCFLLIFCVPSVLSAKSPNFVVIMADDLGAAELGCYGHQEHKTPHLDRLADEGVRFRTCYATPNCSSTRIMLMTGRYGFRTGWYNFLERKYSPAPGTRQFDIGQAEVTFADLLKLRGYATGIAGKWQLPGSPTNRIYDCGFDTYCMWKWKHQLPDIDPKTGRDRRPYQPTRSLHLDPKTERYWNPGVMRNAKQYPTSPKDFGPDIFTKFVCGFMKEHKHEPFLIYYPMVLIHRHGKAWPEVPDTMNPLQKTGGGSLKSNVEYTDHLVGQICAAIDKLGLAENTYVFFTSDNGPAGRGKGKVSEVGVRVPLIIRGPRISPGQVSDDLASLADILPTLVEFSGARLPQNREIDGISLAPTLLERPGPRREWVFSYLADKRMLRDHRWLLDGDSQFYDCGKHRDGNGYQNVTNSNSDGVLQAKQRFQKILLNLPAPKTSGVKQQNQ